MTHTGIENGYNGNAIMLEEDSEEESDHEWEVITIEDDDEVKPRVAPKEMKCFRCPNNKLGTFRDERKYWTHISRHVLPDIFSCVTCQRSFHKLSHCLSHELRVHGTPLTYDIKDKVISTAKTYLKGRQEAINKKSETNTQNAKDDDEIDCEDVMFYGGHFVCSSSIYPYRGPEVNSMLEAYEIQYSYATRRRTPRINNIAKLALDVHEQNVEKNQDNFRLGKFSNRKNRFLKKAPVAVKRPTAKKKPKSTIPAPVQLKRPRDVSESESTKEKPKKKRIIRYFSSSSDTENSDDLDYVPSEEKSNIIKKASENEVAGSSGTHPNKPSRKRQNEDPEEPSKKRMCFSALLKRDCQLCSYVWETENELRIHRDKVHPKNPLIDLMAMPAPVKKAKSFKKLKATKPEVNKESKQPKKPAATGKRNSKKSTNTIDGDDKRPVRKKVVRQGRSLNVCRRSVVPEPDESFTPKELFLHNNFGLTSCVRLHLHQKKALADLKIPQLQVLINRLTDWEIAVCKSGGASRLENYLPPHFLLS